MYNFLKKSGIKRLSRRTQHRPATPVEDGFGGVSGDLERFQKIPVCLWA